jgi:hypothetical protein
MIARENEGDIKRLREALSKYKFKEPKNLYRHKQLIQTPDTCSNLCDIERFFSPVRNKNAS